MLHRFEAQSGAIHMRVSRSDAAGGHWQQYDALYVSGHSGDRPRHSLVSRYLRLVIQDGVQ
jgi:hypothetical protein